MTLWDYTTSGGCASKFPATALYAALESLGGDVGSESYEQLAAHEDAAIVVCGSSHLALTIDFMPPVLPDAEGWATVSTLNALSDVYAVGGQPTFALSIVGVPQTETGTDLVERLVRTSQRTLSRDSVLLVGGHTIICDTPLFGLAVVGTIEGQPWTKTLPDHETAVVLTKPIGTGVSLSVAKRRGSAVDEDVLSCLMQSNLRSRDLLQASGAVVGCTDVTGFGLGNQLAEVAEYSSHAIFLSFESIPTTRTFESLIRDGHSTGLTEANRQHLTMSGAINGQAIPDGALPALTDPQTNGGLLAFIEPSGLDDLRHAFEASGHGLWQIGVTHPSERGSLIMR